jgi:carbon-nitrogen hydrolase
VAESFTVAAVQAAYLLMDREATTSKVEELIASAAAMGARLIVLPEVFVPGTPIWIDAVPIRDGDEAWFARLVDQAVVVPSPTTDASGLRRKRPVHMSCWEWTSANPTERRLPAPLPGGHSDDRGRPHAGCRDATPVRPGRSLPPSRCLPADRRYPTKARCQAGQ